MQHYAIAVSKSQKRKLFFAQICFVKQFAQKAILSQNYDYEA
jgi:hypothetical protein